jgi:hypothetical protein
MAAAGSDSSNPRRRHLIDPVIVPLRCETTADEVTNTGGDASQLVRGKLDRVSGVGQAGG